MTEQELHNIYADLINDGIVDLTPYCKEEYKEYVDTYDGEKMITRVTLELVSGQQPVFIASRYIGDELEESHFYYTDEKAKLKVLMDTWLNKIQCP